MANKIKYLNRTFTGSDLRSGKIFIANSIANDELATDTLDFTVHVQDSAALIGKDGYALLSSDGYTLAVPADGNPSDLINYTYGADVIYHHDNDLIGKFYMNSVKRVGKQQYDVSCISAIGLLDNSRHYGGIYTGALMKDVVSDIIGGVVPYTISAQFQNIPIYGWLPIATRRENFQQILFATGASLKKTVAGEIQIVFLGTSSPTTIGDNRLYIGGNVDLKTPISSVNVTEHGYASTSADELVTLYDGMVAGDNIVSPKGVGYTGGLVTFTDPCHDLTISGGSILERGPNYAVLAQSGYSKLSGKKYTHTTKLIVRNASSMRTRAIVDIKENVATVENATLVTLANSENVAKRVLAYYSGSKQITAGLVVGAERPGDYVKFNDPFDEPATGFINSMDISISNTLKASAVVSTGYAPSDPGNFYKNSILIKNSGSWTIPAGVTKIRFALIGGGRGGPSGKPGNAAQQGGTSSKYDNLFEYTVYYKHAGIPGEGGEGASTGGFGGDVYEMEIPVTPGQSVSLSMGSGGPGGSNGSPTTLTFSGKTYSSSSGGLLPGGYADIFTGEIYAKQNYVPGIKGGTGTGARENEAMAPIHSGSYVYGDNGSWGPGSNGGPGNNYTGGGYGGGAAVGSNGNSGGSGYNYDTGDGGSGATPKAPPATTGVGEGGRGGHGGGGGGGNGYSGVPRTSTGKIGAPGSGGSGGPGGQGGPGGVLIYY